MSAASGAATPASSQASASHAGVGGNATRVNYGRLRQIPPRGTPSYAKRALEKGVTPAGIMSQVEIVATVTRAVEHLGIGTDESDAVVGFVIAFAVINTASDRVLEDPSTDRTFPMYLSTREIDVETIPFFNAVFGMNSGASGIRQFVKAFPERVYSELQACEQLLAARFGITDVWVARGDLFPKNFVEQHKYAPERLKAAKNEAVARGVEHVRVHHNGGTSYDVGNNF